MNFTENSTCKYLQFNQIHVLIHEHANNRIHLTSYMSLLHNNKKSVTQQQSFHNSNEHKTRAQRAANSCPNFTISSTATSPNGTPTS
mmetsp:Transcript_9608/g.20729  ORF Transcript_9608/g.20729 Transcript_9608/m.20729 type:complete len:87 (-) Transcript_9608:334-594(-)